MASERPPDDTVRDRAVEASREPRFAGRTAIVTGAGGGAGLAIARGLDAEGATVVGVDLKERPVELPDRCAYLCGDVTDPELPAGAVARARADGGALDYLVNGAGVAWFGRDGSV